MRALVLVLFFIAVPLAGGSLIPELESEFWKDSGADLEFARTLINNHICASTDRYARSCRQALAVGAEIRGITLTPGPIDDQLAELLEIDDEPEWLVGRVLNAQLKVFDPYAQLAPTAYLRHLLEDQNRLEYGTGLETEALGQSLLVYGILPNSPAARAGLKKGDRIVSIDGDELDSLARAHNGIFKLQRAPGTRLRLEVERGRRRFSVVVEIGTLVVPEDEPEIFVFGGHRSIYLRIRSFKKGVHQKVADILDHNKDAEGLILDLRHNRGGLVEEAEGLIRLFADRPAVVKREDLHLEFPVNLEFAYQRPDHSKPVVGEAPYAKIAVVILTNAKTASASEITAGALQDFGRAWLVGERTYGKGVTQLTGEVPSRPRLRIMKTISQYLRPSGVAVHGVGVSPDFEEPYLVGARAEDRRALREEDVGMPLGLAPREPWRQLRGDEIKKLRACSAVQRAERSMLGHFGYPDHQAAVALAVVTCAAKHNSSATEDLKPRGPDAK